MLVTLSLKSFSTLNLFLYLTSGKMYFYTNTLINNRRILIFFLYEILLHKPTLSFLWRTAALESYLKLGNM